MAKTVAAVERERERESISILELFGGIGACTKALKNIGIKVNVVDYVEIDKYAVKSYNAINETQFEPQDITKWNKNINVDLIMHGSPCQDISIAGLQAGADKDTGTRSSLMYETIRIVEKLNPKYVIWENVKNLLSKKHKHNFDNYIDKLEKLGYNSYYQVLNAKDYGVPQNRERVYTVSIRKDIDNGKFIFPEKEPLKIMLQDLLKKNVDEKYYLTENMINYLENGKYQSAKVSNKIKITETGICSTLDTMQGGNRQPFVKIKYENFINNKGYFPNMFNPYNETEINNIAPAQTTCYGSTTSSATVLINNNERIRKLTPLECWRLMGFDDEDFYKAQSTGNSNSQLYKQARKLNCSKGFRKNIFKFIKGELNGSQRKN